MLNLKWKTPKEWLDVVFSDFNSFLLDHASCERKASSTNMSLVVKYPNRVEILNSLIEMALEELEHFHQVYKIIERRGLILTPDEKDKYVNYMLKYLRINSDERFLDRLLLSGIIEARGCERLNMVANALEDIELKNFYTELTKCEARHHSQFIHLASFYFDKETINKRMEELLIIEAEAIQSVPFRPAIH
ncbi:MAG: tRNA-(ms[2]io[6]A)-hydroxylase [Candidatus Sericytochromatia bacterium]|nr:MAG: tRNA-(ms[2]io[6]A)-hydroxylase [Candidatus Sericytochromatia bacterium]